MSKVDGEVIGQEAFEIESQRQAEVSAQYATPRSLPSINVEIMALFLLYFRH